MKFKLSFNMESFYRVIAKIAFNHLAYANDSEFVLQDSFDSKEILLLMVGAITLLD